MEKGGGDGEGERGEEKGGGEMEKGREERREKGRGEGREERRVVEHTLLMRLMALAWMSGSAIDLELIIARR